jgi:hypothetical protein
LSMLYIMSYYVRRKTVNHWYYLKVPKRLRENIRRERPQLLRNNSWFLHHDTVPSHASLLIRDFLANMNTLCLLSHPTHLTWLRQTFSYFPNWNPLWKDDEFIRSKRLRKIRRWSYVRSQKRHTRAVSRSDNGIGSCASMQEGSTLMVIRLTQLQACSKKL